MENHNKIKSLPQIEDTILQFWQEKNIFTKVVALRKDAKQFVFYDGPPFTTGLPHYGHIMQMANKDAVLRFKTMQGFNVPRKIGWDTHGLPVEYELEKELGLQGGKPAIEAFGIENFVEAARKIVLRYTAEWTKTMERMGRWVNFDHPYTTMDNDYIESVWWAFKTLHDKGLVYKDFRVSPYCPRCGTVLSNFEVNQGYQDNVPDTSIYTALKITSEGKFKDRYLIFWTTTAWSTTAIVAMAVNAEADYVLLNQDDRHYIMARERVGDLFNTPEIEAEFKGSELLGLEYEPLYDVDSSANLHRVVAGDYVSTEDGTGIASIAPAYGEVDAEVGKREGFPVVQTVNPDGTIKKGLGLPGEGLFVKEAEKAIVADLEERGFLVLAQPIKHTYPFCWRCDSPLLYYPATSWFVRVTAIKEQLLEENNEINWLPEHLRDGRFGKWLEGARDWAISRDRYWGAPLPIWECKNGHMKIIGSRHDDKKLEQLNDFHRPYIDSITLNCEECTESMQRVPFVFDCWFESGSMPYAQWHYPFANKEHFAPSKQRGYPADFIGEALDQTRGWFYTLHVLGVALFGQRAYESVVVTGLLLAPDGKKLSKRLRNYVEPEALFEQEGVDALRLFLFTSASLGEDYRFSDAAVRDVKRRWIVPLLNVLEYYKLSLKDKDDIVETQPEHHELDTWIKSRVAQSRAHVFDAMDGDERRSPYDLVRACRTLGPLVEDFSTWYVRLSRGRKDKAFTQTLQIVLEEISKTYASFLPFLTEYIYQNLLDTDAKKLESVHLCTLTPLHDWQNNEILKEMELVRGLVTIGRELRAQAGVALRQPLAVLELAMTNLLHPSAQELLLQELNIKQLHIVEKINPEYLAGSYESITIGLDQTLTEGLRNEGMANMIRRTIQDLRKQAGLMPGDEAKVVIIDLDPMIQKLIQEQLETTHISSEQDINEPLMTGEYKDFQNTIKTIKLYKR